MMDLLIGLLSTYNVKRETHHNSQHNMQLWHMYQKLAQYVRLFSYNTMRRVGGHWTYKIVGLLNI